MECISLLVRRLVTGPFLFWIQQQRYMFTIRRTLYRYKLERYNSWRKYRGEGRMALMAYIYFLVLTGPAENFTANVEVLSKGLSCGQEKIANETRRILEVATSPLKAVYEKAKQIIQLLLDFAKLMKKAFLSIKNLFAEIFGALRRALQWLYHIVSVCNKRMGEPYEKCRKPLEDAFQDCVAMMPSLLNWLCSPVRAVQYICYIAKVIMLLCAIPAIIIDFVKVQVIDRIESAMRRFLVRAYDTFYVNITVTHQYNYTLEFSKSQTEVRQAVLRELRSRVSLFIFIFRVISNVLIGAILYIVYSAVRYRLRYLREDDFDNCYVTWRVVALDKTRARKGLETLLPLRSLEKRDFVDPFCLRLTRTELKALMLNLWSLVVSAVYTAMAFIMDYTLYRLITFVRSLGKVDVNAGLPNQMKIRIEGEGPVADMYRAVADAVSPSDMTKAAVPAVDVQNCLQRPYSPDMDMYYWIGLVYILGILLMLCQTYGLRLRHVVLGIFYPDQDRSRAAWLHSHLLALRTSWLTGLRRAIRRRFGDIEESREPGLYDMLLARVPVLRKTLSILGIRRQHCLACGVSGNIDDEENFKRCETPTCRAVYCNECFEELENLCTVCMNPAEYGDLSDVSEERDSSEADDGPRSQVSESIHDFLRFKLRCSRSASQLQPCVENV
ncbi:DC-STAMP domain-containing protein 2-like isoform X2 [Ornithodoros turicata]|uniref:DC-STAMP domain-containing protein 2-like isoform X2 n=1 Tax=Ornithodoros turicata TaxID=34597 RepID=UPI0031386DF9